MRVLAIGGSGEFGLPTVKVLAGLDEVDEVCIGARDIERAKTASQECGNKVRVVQVDATDEEALVRVIRGFDFVLNMSSYDTELTAVRASIAAGVNYADILSSTTARNQLDGAAREAGITAITGIGLGAGILNILCVHLGAKLDEIKEMQGYLSIACVLNQRFQEMLETCDNIDEICRELLVERSPYWIYAKHLGGRKVDALDYMLSLPWHRSGTSRALGFVDGHWRDVDPIASGIGIPVLGWKIPPYRPISIESIQPDKGFFPRHDWASEASRLFFVGTGLPVPLNARLAIQADRIAAREISATDAAAEVRDQLLSDPSKWLLPPSPVQGGIHVLGFKGGRHALASATIPGLWTEANWYLLTGVPLIVAARRVWRGQVEQKGVLLPEAVFTFESFEAEVADFLPDIPQHGRLFLEKFEYLD